MYLVIGVGFLQIIGWAIGSKEVEGLGFMTNASPLPYVFSIFRGIEPYSSKFEIEITDGNGKTSLVHVTPAIYEQLQGPYNLRNVYGAVIAGSPVLKGPKEQLLVQSVMQFGFCNPGTVARDFGIDYKIAKLRMIQTSRAEGIPGQWTTEVVCP
jgi:hypothetical protein